MLLLRRFPREISIIHSLLKYRIFLCVHKHCFKMEMEQIENLQAQVQQLTQQLQAMQATIHPVNIVPPPNRPKLAKPPKYSGKGSPYIDEWLYSVENACLDCQNDVAFVVRFATSLLEGDALTWWHSVRSNPPQNDNNERLWNWDNFKLAITRAFQPIDPETSARDKLYSLHQKTTVNAYVNAFRQAVSRIGTMSEDDKIYRFTLGLKADIRQQVRIQRVTTLEEAMQVASRAEGIEQAGHSGTHGGGTQASDGPTPMELGTMHKKKFHKQQHNGGGGQRYQGNQAKYRKKHNFRKLAQLAVENKCFECEKPGHFAANCPNKPKN